MENTGRFWVRVGNRTFCVEPIEGRQRSKEWGWYEGLQAAKGGAVRPEDSLITKENGFAAAWELPEGTSPEGFIHDLVAGKLDGQDCRIF